MRLRNTILALILLTGLLGFIYYHEYLGEQTREATAESEKNVLTFERDKVQEIEILRPGAGALTLHKQTEGWSLSAPSLTGATRADQEKVDQILSALSFLRLERKMEGIAEGELDGFKLKEPAARVTLKLDPTKPDLVLNLGDKSPVGGFCYASRPGSPDVFLVSGSVDSIVGAEPGTLRYKKIVGLDVWKVARFSIEKGDRLVTLRHGAAGSQDEDWKLERPVAFPADATKVQGLWYDLQAAEAEGFETERPLASDLERFGLTRPEFVLTVEPKETGSPIKVVFGRSGPTGPPYARRSDMDAVMRVKPEILDKLEKAVSDLDDLRDARIAPVDRFKLGGIEIQRPGSTVSLVKDDASKWHWGEKEGPEMSSEEVNGLIDAIEGAKATGFLDAAGPAQAGEPALTLTVREGGEGARAVTVRVGGEGSSAAGRRVTTTATTTVYIVPPAAIQTLVDRVSTLKAPQAATAAAAAEGAPEQKK